MPGRGSQAATPALAALAGLAFAGACYRPDLRDCDITCQQSEVCPDGLECRADGFCVTPGFEEACPGAADAAVVDGPGLDALTRDAGTEMCGFAAFPPTHFDPCVVAGEGDWEIGGDLIYDTTTGIASGSPMGAAVAQVPVGPTDVRLVRVGMFRVGTGATLTVTGDHPLVIAADTVIVDGTIAVQTGPAPAEACGAPSSGMTGSSCGAGGSGGGFGATGGAGSNCTGSGAPQVTAVAGDDTQIMLRAGCTGGNGGANPGWGGAGGGALQLSASVSIRVTGTVTAPGGGGTGGANALPSGGGGGGGSGGALFLEAPMIELTAASRLCANGGGGGEGHSNSGNGPAGTCADAAAVTPGVTNGGNGGRGGHLSMPDGGAGGGAALTNLGGGGGGGGVGRIRLRAQTVPMADGLVTPAPSVMTE